MTQVKNVSPTKPVRVRTEDSAGNVYFVTVFGNGTIKIRPKGSRTADAEVFATAEQVYSYRLLKRAKTNTRRKPVRRGLLATERNRGL